MKIRDIGLENDVAENRELKNVIQFQLDEKRQLDETSLGNPAHFREESLQQSRMFPYSNPPPAV